MGCLLQVFANQKDKSRHLYEHFNLGRCNLIMAAPSPIFRQPGYQGRSPWLVGTVWSHSSQSASIIWERRCRGGLLRCERIELAQTIPLLAEEGWTASLIDGAPGAKREPDRAKPQLMVSSAKLFSQLLVVAVGMAITGHPPHRSERTGFPYSALASGHPPKRADG